ncbi:MAG: hypothetical protein IKL16_03490 [Clostridia bacterium]|nr:hypothetical protein [Clostridia bacterium]
MRKLVFACISMLFIFASVFSLSASGAEEINISDRIFTISAGGDETEAEPYSKEAIESAIDLGFDAVSVKVGEDGIETKGLPEILTFAKEDFSVIIDCTEENFNDVYKVAKDYDYTYLRVRDLSTKRLVNWAHAMSNRVQVIPSYDGNVIFSAISAYNTAKDNYVNFCEFSSKNRYSVIFSEFFTKRFDGTWALMSFADKDLCGQRDDGIHGWESAISMGYKAIETDNEREFMKYLSLLEESYEHLESVYNEAKETDLSPYSVSSTKDFEKYVNLAEEMLTSENASSQLEINECIENIENSYSEFQLSEGEEENKTFSVTPMKIFWICFAIALFVSSQIYLHKKTKKK